MSIFEAGDSNLIVGAASANATGGWLNVSKCDFFSVTLRVAVTAATLQATFKLQGSDFGTKSGSEGTLVNFAMATVLPTGITYSTSTGVVTINNAAIGTSEIVLTALSCPRFVRGVWTFTSGGGTVAADAALSCW